MLQLPAVGTHCTRLSESAERKRKRDKQQQFQRIWTEGEEREEQGAQATVQLLVNGHNSQILFARVGCPVSTLPGITHGNAAAPMQLQHHRLNTVSRAFAQHPSTGRMYRSELADAGAGGVCRVAYTGAFCMH